jgi:hypothetical protein
VLASGGGLGAVMLATALPVHPAGAVATPRIAVVLPAGYSAANLVFMDNFAGGRLDASRWNRFLTSRAAGGWPWNSNRNGGSSPANPSVNYDQEYDLPSQVHVKNGLVIRAVRRPTSGVLGSGSVLYPWRSGAVSSYGHFQFAGGYLQVVAKMPSQPGLWPGLWMLPGTSGSGGDNYEIDLFEGGMLAGSANPATTFSWHLHTPSGIVGGTVPVGVSLGSAYHRYGLEWVPGRSITWYFDGRVVGRVTSATVSIPTEPMEILLNVQVANAAASTWHSMPTSSTTAGAMRIRSVAVLS